MLASTSPQRKAILEQLHIPFEVVAPKYQEATPADGDALQVVRDHARGKVDSGYRLYRFSHQPFNSSKK